MSRYCGALWSNSVLGLDVPPFTRLLHEVSSPRQLGLAHEQLLG